jgi:hypothetical protein
MLPNRFCAGAGCALAWLAFAQVAHAETNNAAPTATRQAEKTLKCEGTKASGANAPTPADPYPLNAAGWGPEAGNGRFFSRWAEDWTGMRAAGNAPAYKAMPLGGDVSLTLSSEVRARFDVWDNGRLVPGNDYQQALLRVVNGADLRLNPSVRVYGEIASGLVSGRRGQATANFDNKASLQQLFIDIRGYAGSTLVGAMVGRQEFADGPRQLISLSDGPNIHRSWNGVRLYAHGQRLRAGAFDLRATRLERGFLDEGINDAERLQGVNASLIVSPRGRPNIYLEPFWIHSEKPGFRAGDQTGVDDRHTFGARLWGRQGRFRFDWTIARQTGEFMDRDVDAWGVFAVQSLSLSDKGWKPRLTSHVDIASGGTRRTGALKGFNQLYASSNYLGEGQFLSLSNLLLIAPGIALSPTSKTSLSAELGFARRLKESDAAYAGGMRAYAGTELVRGHEIGRLLRINGSWSASKYLTFFVNYERLDAGRVLERARLPSGSYGYVGATFRY